jgi:hypothetical protein
VDIVTKVLVHLKNGQTKYHQNARYWFNKGTLYIFPAGRKAKGVKAIAQYKLGELRAKKPRWETK